MPYPSFATAESTYARNKFRSSGGFPISPYSHVHVVPYPLLSSCVVKMAPAIEKFPASPFIQERRAPFIQEGDTQIPQPSALRPSSDTASVSPVTSVSPIPYPLPADTASEDVEYMQSPDWRGIFTRFYRHFAPSKAESANIEKLVKKYTGKEIALLNKLFKKYSVEPSKQLLFAGPDVMKPRGRKFPPPPKWKSYTSSSGGAAFWQGKDLVYLDVQFGQGQRGTLVIELFSG